jgi:hypothetical protein
MSDASQLQGKTVGVPARSWIQSEIRAVVDPGGSLGTYSAYVDGTGLNPRTRLHFIYRGNLNCSFIDPGASQLIEVEFDALSSFRVPNPGDLALLGGSGDYIYWVNYERGLHIDCVGQNISEARYEPSMKTLRTLVPASDGAGGSSLFIVPKNHTWLWGYGPNYPMTEVNSGVTITPSPVFPGIPVNPGDVFMNGNNAQVVVTGWLG